jgi:hypothetical protein
MKSMTAVVIGALVFAAYGKTTDAVTQNKNVTIITGQSTADGRSEVREQLLEECIVSLPTSESLDAVVQSQPVFLKEINGDPGRNDFVKTYSAFIDINYIVYQKVLFIVSTSSVSGIEPTMKVMEKRIRHNIQFNSNPQNGDLYAGRSRREYYFSTSDAAIADARKQALVWLRQQAPVVCKSTDSK